MGSVFPSRRFPGGLGSLEANLPPLFPITDRQPQDPVLKSFVFGHGLILDPESYKELVQARCPSATTYFPAYRYKEFR